MKVSLAVFAALFLQISFAQQSGGRGHLSFPLRSRNRPSREPVDPLEDQKPVVTKHEMQLNGKTLSYTATTGMMPIKNDHGDIEANLFYVAYTLDGVADRAKRPLMFSFNGGPGSASVWLHMGCVGPGASR